MVVVAVVLVGCQQSVDSYCTARARAECKKEQRCGRVSKQVDCQQYAASNDCLSELQPAIDAKRVTWDAFAANRCVDAIEHEACDTYTGESDACSALVVGKKKLGEFCGGCVAGLFCVPNTRSNCGTCQADSSGAERKKPGEACVSFSGAPLYGCERGSYCFGVLGSAVCTLRTADDQACSSGACGEASSCVDSVCRPKGDLGEACNGRTLDCLGGLICENAHCARQRAVGAACDHAWQCLSNICFEGACTLSRKKGETCDASAPCVATATCINGTCVDKARPGETCNPDVGCFAAECIQIVNEGAFCTRAGGCL